MILENAVFCDHSNHEVTDPHLDDDRESIRLHIGRQFTQWLTMAVVSEHHGVLFDGS